MAKTKEKSKSKDKPKSKPNAAQHKSKKAVDIKKLSKSSKSDDSDDNDKKSSHEDEDSNELDLKGQNSEKKSALKKDSSKKDNKSRKNKKKEETGLDDDFSDADFEASDFGNDEIAEYEEELAEVESLDDVDSEDSAWSESVLGSNENKDEEVYLTDAEGRRYCRVRDCDQASAVDAYCRFHYLLLWKKIQVRKKILQDGKLERYVEELTARYPDKFLEMIRRDLRTEKDFLSAIQELELDDSGSDNDFEEDAQSFIDEVRGMGEAASVSDDDEF